MARAEPEDPSPFLRAQWPLLREAARRGAIADLACGRGRHALAVAPLGALVVALDRDRDALTALRRRASGVAGRVACARTDLETPFGIPLRAGSCGAVLVFRFLFRPLADAIVRCLAPGGLLLYETFTLDQREVGYGPSNPDFLLRPQELPGLFPQLEVLDHAEGWFGPGRPAALARLVARRPAS